MAAIYNVRGVSTQWRTIWSSSIWMFLAAIFSVGGQWLLSSIVAHRDGALGLGYFSLAQAYVTSISYLAWLAFRNHYIIDGAKFIYSDYLYLRLIFPAILFSAVIFLLWYLRIGSFELVSIIFSLSCLKFVEGLSDLNSGVFQRLQKNWLIAACSGARLICCIVVFPIVFLVFGTMQIALLALAGSWVLVYLLFDNPARRTLLPVLEVDMSERQKAMWRRWALFKLSLPLGFSSMVMSLSNYLPRLSIDRLLGPQELGHFAAIQYFANFGGVIVTVVCQASLTSLVRYRDQGDARHFMYLVGGLCLFTFSGSCCALLLTTLFGQKLLTALYGPSFSDLEPVFLRAIPSILFYLLGAIAATASAATRIYRIMFVGYISSALVTGGLSWVLVGHYGVEGAFISMGCAGVVQSLIMCFGTYVAWQKTSPNRS